MTQDRKRWIALVVLCTGMLMIILDSAIVNVALPAIQNDLGFSNSSLTWVVDAYLITFGGLLLLAGRLGDLLGRRRVFLVGLVVFTLASLACGGAQTQAELIVARLVQGGGGALTSSVILGIIFTTFTDQSEQTRAIGVFAFVASSGASLGLLLGGILTDAISWHWIFFVNVPIGIVTWLLARRLVEEDTGLGLSSGADALGGLLVTGALMLAVYDIVKVDANGWGSARTLGLGAVAIGLLAGFVVRQQRAAQPLLPLRLLRSRNVYGANLIQMLMVAGLFGMFFLGTLYLGRVLGYSPLKIGFAFLPTSTAIGGLSLGGAERLARRFGPKNTLTAGLVLVLAGLLLLARVPVDGGYLVDVLPATLLLGAGAGTLFPAVISLAISGATMEDSGVVSGLTNTTQQVGGALGLSVLSTFAATRAENLQRAGTGARAALTSGYHLGFAIAAGCVAVAVVLSLVVIEPAGARAAAPAVDDLEDGVSALAVAETS